MKALENGEINLSHKYSPAYKDEIFWIWYNNSRCSPPKLIILIHPESGYTPSVPTLQGWIGEGWHTKADELDQEIKDQFTKEVIETKVEMLRRHAEIGKEVLGIGLDWITENKDKLTANAAVRLLREGHEMERASVGVPEALEKMMSTSDDELKKQIEAIVTGDDILDADL